MAITGLSMLVHIVTHVNCNLEMMNGNVSKHECGISSHHTHTRCCTDININEAKLFSDIISLHVGEVHTRNEICVLTITIEVALVDMCAALS